MTMDLSPEDRERIYAEEKARLDAQEQLRKEAEDKHQQEERARKAQDAKNLRNGCLGCFGFIVVLSVVVAVLPQLRGPTDPGAGETDQAAPGLPVARDSRWCALVLLRDDDPSIRDNDPRVPAMVAVLDGLDSKVRENVENISDMVLKAKQVLREEGLATTNQELLIQAGIALKDGTRGRNLDFAKTMAVLMALMLKEKN